MRAITVAVEYTDLLAITLPYNLHHFEKFYIVTDLASYPSVMEVVASLPEHLQQPVKVFPTNLFYDNGAIFNKWLALEWGLDKMGRHGWICQLDADILLPEGLKWNEKRVGTQEILELTNSSSLRAYLGGYLIVPWRRIAPLPLPSGIVPPESEWSNYRLYREREFAGYSQIYHADDPVLGPAPWHETNWVHAGGADSFFQAKWPMDLRIRPNFEVLHLGSPGVNWCGRTEPYVAGGRPDNAQVRLAQLEEYKSNRKRYRDTIGDQYAGEKLSIGEAK